MAVASVWRRTCEENTLLAARHAPPRAPEQLGARLRGGSSGDALVSVRSRHLSALPQDASAALVPKHMKEAGQLANETGFSAVARRVGEEEFGKKIRGFPEHLTAARVWSPPSKKSEFSDRFYPEPGGEGPGRWNTSSPILEWGLGKCLPCLSVSPFLTR